ncbi:oxidative damage protection protein [Buchnera aphidicola (Nipponaphis monzeni)]|uniref:Oxidative damage protection protein n=1 Tax=Buchnera aphidicola (Nipponaphis monzeni) TaxID=2495405 RepID=A0A455TAT0_9GAMM|nr:oxidative damage protection protein [Buchnera aphidicola]BBI01425.1 oxidative damage protection protein [Buchnera aphidicola (Nipponaphis monzeni)]
MKKKIFCTFLKKYANKQSFQIYPGKIGKRIYNEISQKAWDKWMIQQTMIINEKKLNMTNINDQKEIKKNMINFLFNKENI